MTTYEKAKKNTIFFKKAHENYVCSQQVLKETSEDTISENAPKNRPNTVHKETSEGTNDTELKKKESEHSEKKNTLIKDEKNTCCSQRAY